MWISVKEASQALNVTPRAIRKACLAGSKKYTYRVVAGHGGNGSVYEIWQNDTARKVVLDTELKLSSEDKGVLKTKLCAMVVNKDSKMTLERFLGEIGDEFSPIRPNVSKVRRWMREYSHAVDNGVDATVVLRDDRGRPKGCSSLSTDMKAMIESYLLRRDRRPTVMGIYAKLTHLFSDVPSLRTVERYVEGWKRVNAHLYAHATNPDRAKGRLKPAIGSASEAYTYINCAWELDATPADVMTSDGKRWSIYAAIDVYSRRVAVTMEKSTSAFAVSRNLRVAMLKLGLPELLITDNGRDYVNNHIDEMCIRMGIGKREVPPYSGEKKPHVERFFGTLTRGLFRETLGYVGASVAERQEIRSSKSFEQRLRSIERWKAAQWDEEGFAKALLKSKEADLFVEVPLTPEELQGEIDRWVMKYENSLHRSIGSTPVQRWESGGVVRRVADERTLDVLMGESHLRTVSKEGIVFTLDGIKTYYWGVELVAYIGMKVTVILPDDMARIEVYDPITSKHICTAIDPALMGDGKRSLIRETHKAYRRATAKANKAVRDAEERGKEYDAKIKALTDEEAVQKSDPPVPKPERDNTSPKSGGGKEHYASLADRFIKRMRDGSWNEKDDQLAKENPDVYEIVLNMNTKTA